MYTINWSKHYRMKYYTACVYCKQEEHNMPPGYTLSTTELKNIAKHGITLPVT